MTTFPNSGFYFVSGTGVRWQDFPSNATALSAANIQDLENRVTNYTDLRIPQAASAGKVAKSNASGDIVWSTLSSADLTGTGALINTNNLSDVSNTTAARTNLGLGTASTQATTFFLQTANNLSDLANAATARTNLGIGSAGQQASSFFLQTANNLSDIPNAATARANLGITSGNALPSVLDFGAKVDGKMFTAGGVAVGTSATFTDTVNTPFSAADVNKIVVLPGGGVGGRSWATPIVAFTDSGHVTLATPPPNPAGVTGPYVYGTDDTGAIQGAINSKLALTFPNATGLVQSLAPVSGGTYFGNGCNLYKIPTSTWPITLAGGGNYNNAVFYARKTDGVSIIKSLRFYDFNFFGEGWNSTWTNYTTADLFQQDAIWMEQVQDSWIDNCTATGFINSAFSWRDCARAWVTNCKVTATCIVQGRNAISFGDSNFGNANITPTTDFTATNNFITDCLAGGIVMVVNYTNVATPLNALISNNNIRITGGNDACIGLELDSSTSALVQGRNIIISDNIVVHDNPASGFASAIFLLDDGPTPNNDPTQLQDILVKDNVIHFGTVNNGNGAITVKSGRTLVSGNEIELHGNQGGRALFVVAAPTTALLNNSYYENNHVVISTATPSNHVFDIQHLYWGGIFGNTITYLCTPVTTTAQQSDGIHINNSQFVNIDNNTVINAMNNGIFLGTALDYSLKNNYIKNPNLTNTTSTSLSNGIFISGQATNATLNQIVDNTIIDDGNRLQTTGVTQMINSVRANSAAGVLFELRNNRMIGAKTAHINTPANFALIRGNVTDTPGTFPASTSNGTFNTTFGNTNSYDIDLAIFNGTGGQIQYTPNGGLVKTIWQSGATASMNVLKTLQPGDMITLPSYASTPSFSVIPRP